MIFLSMTIFRIFKNLFRILHQIDSALLCLLIMLILLPVFLGCSTTPRKDAGLSTIAGERNYTRIIKDHEGKPFLKLTCEYIGKQPLRDFWHKVPWEVIDTDFYRLTFENLSTHRIELVSRKIHQKYSQPMKWQMRLADGKILEYSTTKNSAFIDFSRVRNAESNVLLPKEKRIQSNWFYHTNGEMPHNVLIIVYTINYLGKEYSFNAPMVYQR